MPETRLLVVAASLVDIVGQSPLQRCTGLPENTRDGASSHGRNVVRLESLCAPTRLLKGKADQ